MIQSGYGIENEEQRILLVRERQQAAFGADVCAVFLFGVFAALLLTKCRVTGVKCEWLLWRLRIQKAVIFGEKRRK